MARAYFAVQALAGAAWWLLVFTLDDVRRWTLGELSAPLLAAPDLALFVGASALAAAIPSRASAIVATTWTVLVTVALGVYAVATREAGWGALLMTAASFGSLVSAAVMWFGRLPLRWFFIGPFAFREAPEAARERHLLRSLAQLVVFWTSFLVLLPVALAWIERRLRLAWSPLDDSAPHRIGAAVFLAASALGLWSCVSMALRGEGTPLPAATARKLVVVGPYRFVRNPMAVAGAFQTVGMGLWLGSWLVVASALAGALVWNTLIRPEEENDLATRFGDEYDRYRSLVRCWIPSRRLGQHPLATSVNEGRPR